MEFLAAMERTALILVLALTLPLAFYGVPYASAVVAQTTYVVLGSANNIQSQGSAHVILQCSSPSDSTQNFFHQRTDAVVVSSVSPRRSDGFVALTGDNPNGWSIGLFNPTNSNVPLDNVWIICQSPITIAGISVPEFGSLYVAIAMSAVVYFFLARRTTATKPASIRPN